MTKLLRAGYRRYFKSPIFWISLGLCLFIGIFYAIKLSNDERIDEMMIVWQMFVFAVMISLSVGREYSDGGFRNKIIAGHTKSAIFFSEYILSVSLCFSMFLLSVGIFALMSLDDMARIGERLLLWSGSIAVLSVLSMITVLTFISITVPKRAFSAVIGLVFVLMSSVWTAELYDQLEYREFTRVPIYDENGHPTDEMSEPVPNPKYVGGVKRNIYEFLYYSNPIGQLTELKSTMRPFFDKHRELLFIDADIIIENMTDFEIYGLQFYSLGTLITVGVLGFVIFRKKNIK